MQRVICVWCFCYFMNNEKHFQISLTYKNNNDFQIEGRRAVWQKHHIKQNK